MPSHTLLSASTDVKDLDNEALVAEIPELQRRLNQGHEYESVTVDGGSVPVSGGVLGS